MVTHDEFEGMLAKELPQGTEVEVTTFEGSDEPGWSDPIYVVAYDPNEEIEYYDAVCDLLADTAEKQVKFVLEQLRNG